MRKLYSLIYINKRGMQSKQMIKQKSELFIFGNIKYKVFKDKDKYIMAPRTRILDEEKKKYENVIKFLESKITRESTEAIIKQHSLLIKESERKIEIINKINSEYKSFNPTKKIHGFGGIIINDNVYLAMHTSSKTSPLFGTLFSENIAVGEELNPIKYVNTIQKVPLQLFKLIFKITNPVELLLSPRYAETKEKDLAYCTLRAFYKSLLHSDKMICLQEKNPQLLSITQEEINYVQEDKIVKLPSQYEIETVKNDYNYIQEKWQEIEYNANNDEYKLKLITEGLKGYNIVEKYKYD